MGSGVVLLMVGTRSLGVVMVVLQTADALGGGSVNIIRTGGVDADRGGPGSGQVVGASSAPYLLLKCSEVLMLLHAISEGTCLLLLALNRLVCL